MRLVSLSCILLAAIICTCAGNVVPATGENQSAIHQAPDVTTAVPLSSVNAINPAIVSNTSKILNSTSNSALHNSNFTANGINNDTLAPTTALPMSSSVPTSVVTTMTPVSPITTKLTTTTKVEPTTEKSTTSNTLVTTTNSSIPSSPPSVTTAVPISTKEAPPSQSPDKERHFDGLSFVGGIILAVCLMAIGTFSCKFYRTLKEGNYRTL